MKAKHRTKRIQRYRKMLGIIVLMLTITLIGVVVSATVLYKRKNACKTPDTTLVEYMMHIPKQEYEEMYAMIDLESSGLNWNPSFQFASLSSDLANRLQK